MSTPPIALPVAKPIVKKTKEEEKKAEMIEAKIIVVLDHTKIYKLEAGTKHLLHEGTLQVMTSQIINDDNEQEEVVILQMEQFTLVLRLLLPCLEMAPRNYVFPSDTTTYGVVISEHIPEEVEDILEILLQEHTSFRRANEQVAIQQLEERKDTVVVTSHSVAYHIDSGSKKIAAGLVAGAAIAGTYIVKGGEFLKTRIRPNSQPSQVSQQTKDKITKAKFVSGAAVQVSKALVVGAMATTATLSKQISEAIEDTEVGKKFREQSTPRVEAAKTVAKSTVGAILTLYEALEKAGITLLGATADATVNVVRHKYGEETGNVTEEGMGVVKNIGQSALDMKKVGIKSIAKYTAAGTVQQLASTEEERKAAEAQAAQAQGTGTIVPGLNNMQALQAGLALATVQQALAPGGATMQR